MIGQAIMTRLRGTAFLALLLLLTACTPAAQPAPEVSRAETTPSPSETPVEFVPSPTRTATPWVSRTPSFTRTIAVTPTPTSLPEISSVTRQCPTIDEKVQKDLKIEGILIFTPLDNEMWQQIYLMDMQTGQVSALLGDGDRFFTLIVSPDSKWFAYSHSKDYGHFIIMSSDQEVVIHIPREEEWGSKLSAWPKMDTLLISKHAAGNPALFAVNPFTGESKDLPPLPDDIYDLIPNIYWQSMGYLSYDANLKYRVYPSNFAELVLQDLTTLDDIARLEAFNYYANPRWAPNDRGFVFTNFTTTNNMGKVSNSELFLLDVNGNIEQLSDFKDYYPNAWIYYYTWSPDGKQIAYWIVDHEKQPASRLGVLDMDTKTAVDLCLTSTGYGDNLPPRLFWSPDGKQLLVEIIDGIDWSTARSMVIDLEEGWATTAAALPPIGWLILPDSQ
jgi:hypothetical protein